MTSNRSDENAIVFSPNGLGVCLLTRYGELQFPPEEFNYYQTIFNVITTSTSSPLKASVSRGFMYHYFILFNNLLSSLYTRF